MAKLIDAAKMAYDDIRSSGEIFIQILPSERQCDYDGEWMQLTIRDNGNSRLRTHRCLKCGFTREYGGMSPNQYGV